jgi:2-iminoacetate synthase ThiH
MLNPSIDLSNPCNLNCPCCFIEEKSSAREVRKPNELSVRETLQVVDDLASAGAETVNIVRQVTAGATIYFTFTSVGHFALAAGATEFSGTNWIS